MNSINFYGPSKFSCFVLDTLYLLNLRLTYKSDGTWLLRDKNKTLNTFSCIHDVKEALKGMVNNG